jgi:hypothetical protein
VFGGDPRALLLQRRIDPVGDQLLGIVSPRPGIGEADLRPAAKVQRLLPVEKAVSKSP